MDKILTRIITIPIDKLKGLRIKTIVKIHEILFPIISAQILEELDIKIGITGNILEGTRILTLEFMMISL